MKTVPIHFVDGPLKDQRLDLPEPLPEEQVFYHPKVIPVAGHSPKIGYWYRRLPTAEDDVVQYKFLRPA